MKNQITRKESLFVGKTDVSISKCITIRGIRICEIIFSRRVSPTIPKNLLARQIGYLEFFREKFPRMETPSSTCCGWLVPVVFETTVGRSTACGAWAPTSSSCGTKRWWWWRRRASAFVCASVVVAAAAETVRWNVKERCCSLGPLRHT